MPRRSRKQAPKNERCANQLSTKSDFTVYEFAHSSCGSNLTKHSTADNNKTHSERLRKAAANAWRAEVKQLTGRSVLHQCDNIENNFDDDIADVLDDRFLVSSCESNELRAPLAVGKNCNTDASQPQCSVIYPLDLWFLVAEFIKPEDVVVFARICHYTHIVVHSASFWFSLYRRFCSSSPDLPQSLQPNQVLHRTHGLRTRVVRALCTVYSPLSSRTNHSVADPDSLVGLRCVLAWYEHLPKCQWRFFFRFQRGGGAGSAVRVASSCSLSSSHRSTDAIRAPADVMHNPDERSIVLVATTPHFVPLPVVLGQVLVQAAVSGAIFTQSLRLVFSSEYVHASRANVAAATIAVIDPIVSVRILHWWNPGFPHRL